MSETLRKPRGLKEILDEMTTQEVIDRVEKKLAYIAECIPDREDALFDNNVLKQTGYLQAAAKDESDESIHKALYAYVFTCWHSASKLILNREEALAFIGKNEGAIINEKLNECEKLYTSVFNEIYDIPTLLANYDALCTAYDMLDSIRLNDLHKIDPFFCRYGIIENYITPPLKEFNAWTEHWTKRVKEPRMLIPCEYALRQDIDPQTKQDCCLNYAFACCNRYRSMVNSIIKYNERERELAADNIAMLKKQGRWLAVYLVALALILALINVVLLPGAGGFWAVFFIVIGDIIGGLNALFTILCLTGLGLICQTLRRFIRNQKQIDAGCADQLKDFESFRYSLDEYFKELCCSTSFLPFTVTGPKIEKTFGTIAAQIIDFLLADASCEGVISCRVNENDIFLKLAMIPYSLIPLLLFLCYRLKTGSGKNLQKVIKGFEYYHRYLDKIGA